MSPRRGLSRRGIDSRSPRWALARRLWLEPLEGRHLLAAIQVNTEFDTVDANPAVTSLREAVTMANDTANFPGHDTITFANALANKPVVLSTLNGQITISDTLTIQGLGSARTIVDGLNAIRLFDITNTAGDVTFDGLTLTRGKTTANFEEGGAIRSLSAGQLTIQNSVVSGNSTTGGNVSLGGCSGGGIAALGSVRVANSTISGNSTMGKYAHGGGIQAGSVTVTNSTISGNSIEGTSAYGGGIQAGSVTVTNSTISGNSAFNLGGGVFAFNSITVTNSTITANSISSTGEGGGVFSNSGPATILNSILAGNSNSDFVQFSGTPTIQFSMVGGNPMLGPLVDNGGPTKTHRPLVGSPVIDAGSNGLAIDPGPPQVPLDYDQRGAPFDRIVDGPDAGTVATVDMGAVELAPCRLP